MKKATLIFCLLLALPSLSIIGQNVTVSFLTEDVPCKDTLRQTMEVNLGGLLSEMQQAFSSRRDLILKENNLSEDAKKSLSTLWESASVQSFDAYLLLSLQNDPHLGFFTDKVPMQLLPRADITQDYYVEATVYFAPDGQITGFLFGMGQMFEPFADDVARQRVVTFCELLRKDANAKSVRRLRDALAGDALIVTRQAVTGKSSKQEPVITCVQDFQQTPKEYLSGLQKSLKREKYCDIVFDQVDIVRSLNNPAHFGILIHQKWNSTTRHDAGYSFVICDFTYPDDPIIRFIFTEWGGADPLLAEGFTKNMDYTLTQNITSFIKINSK